MGKRVKLGNNGNGRTKTLTLNLPQAAAAMAAAACGKLRVNLYSLMFTLTGWPPGCSPGQDFRFFFKEAGIYWKV